MPRWLDRLVHSKDFHVRRHSDTVDLATDENERVTAERKLADTERVGHEVRHVSEVARKLREVNNFSARIGQALGRDLPRG